ncbi:acyltransferase family protein [Oribacterium sp. NK2B42]|uniref:acyltransferase family protein n=1 Tax=Oribacterium sp. NK2B42 TaxID=689781 RepID=UPI0004157782|nr:acyltransferase family protein [Oribacterium sp. NK2B42]
MNQKRISRYDNLKGLLIILVVLVHVMLSRKFIRNNEFPVCLMIESIIESFTMPAFVFVSGMFATKKMTYEGQIEKLVSNLFLPYMIFHLLYWAIFNRALKQVFDSSYHTWYLLSLFCWRLMVKPISKIRFQFLFSIVWSLICGFTPAGQMLSISRTICFFPYFLAGYYTDKELIPKLGNTFVKKILAAGVILSIFLLVISLWQKGLPMVKFAYNRDGYAYFGMSNIHGVLLRSLGYLIGFSVTICLIILIPDKECFLTSFGRNTMPLYILHPFIIKTGEKVLRKTQVLSSMRELEFLLFSVIITVTLCVLLSSQYVSSNFQRFMDVVTRCFVKKEQTAYL